MQKFQNDGNSSEKKIQRIPLFWNFGMNFIGWGSGYRYCRTKSKTPCFISFRWSFMEKSSAHAIYLLFEELSLPGIFVYKNCLKSINNFFLHILRVYLSSPTSVISIFILETSKNILKNSLFWGGLKWYDPLRGSPGVKSWKWEWFCRVILKTSLQWILSTLFSIYFSTHIEQKNVCKRAEQKRLVL